MIDRILSTFSVGAARRTLVIGIEGIVLEPPGCHARLVPFDSFLQVRVDGPDVIVHLRIGSEVQMRTQSLENARALRDGLKRWFEHYNELLFNADDVEPDTTSYRRPALDPAWSVAFSPGRPMDERARAAIQVLRDPSAVRTANASRLKRVASMSVRHEFTTLVHALANREELSDESREGIARALGLDVDEIPSGSSVASHVGVLVRV